MPGDTNRAVPVVVALAAALLSVGVSSFVPLLGPLLVALLLGAVVANTPWGRDRMFSGHEAVTRAMLRWGVVLLGLRISGAELLSVGLAGLVVVVATVLATYAATTWLGHRLGLDRGFVTLVAAGFSICGAAAIAAVNDAVRARERDVGLAVALVTVYGSVMIVAVPASAVALGLDDRSAATWAGASIHEVAQVIAAASLLGTTAVAVATTVKLGRVLLLAPVYLAAAHHAPAGRRATTYVPWFVVGFALAAALRSTGVLPTAALEGAQVVTTLLLAGAMFGLGQGIRLRELWPIPPAALVLATASTLVAAGTSLALVVLLLP